MTLISSVDLGRARASGTQTYVLGLARRLRSRGVAVALVTRDGAGTAPEGVESYRIASGPSNADFLARLALEAPRLRIPPHSILHYQRPDAIAMSALGWKGRPVVCTLHGIPSEAVRQRRGRSLGFLYRALEQVGLRRALRIIVVESRTLQWYAGRYDWLADRLVLVPVAVDTAAFKPLDREAARRRFEITTDRAVLYAGRLAPEKRVDEIIRAFRKVPRAELLIAGEGPQEAALRSQATDLPVRFLGSISHEEMPILFNAVDILVLASEYEGLPTVALEALACGTPVVSTPVGGTPEIVIPGRTGWLCDHLPKLGELIGDAVDRAPTLRSSCVAAAQPYSWDSVIDRLLAVYREVER